ncbi:MAG: class I SAM-dependent methyltransferase [Bacteroidales bacterium]
MTEFDKKAKEWDKDPQKIDRAEKFAFQIIQKKLKHSKIATALEFGAGTGQVSLFLKDYINQIYLVDKSEGMINVLRENIKNREIKNMHPILGDVVRNNLQFDSVEMIYSLMSFHHVENLEQLLHHFHRILDPGGVICVGDLEKEDGSFHHFSPDFKGHFGFDRPEIEKIMHLSGFKEIHYEVFYHLKRETLTPENQKKTQSFPLFFAIYEKI